MSPPKLLVLQVQSKNEDAYRAIEGASNGVGLKPTPNFGLLQLSFLRREEIKRIYHRVVLYCAGKNKPYSTATGVGLSMSSQNAVNTASKNFVLGEGMCEELYEYASAEPPPCLELVLEKMDSELVRRLR